MEPKEKLYLCHRCHRLLPAEKFYIVKRSGTPDSYCRLCRKRQTTHYLRLRRLRGLGLDEAAVAQALHDLESPAPPPPPPQPDYPVLTSLPPGSLRHELLHRALERVRESVRRKQFIIHNS